jgi:hypothetical protein
MSSLSRRKTMSHQEIEQFLADMGEQAVSTKASTVANVTNIKVKSVYTDFVEKEATTEVDYIRNYCKVRNKAIKHQYCSCLK